MRNIKRLALAVLLALCCVHPAAAAVSFDCFFEDGASSQASPFTVTSGSATTACTLAANANRVLIVAFISRTDAVGTVTATWDGVTMDVIGTANPAGSLGLIRLFGLKNPNAGSKALVATWSGSADTITMHGWSLYNADQTTGYQNFASNTATSTALSTGAITSTSGNMVVAAAFDDNASGGTFSGGATSDLRDGRFDGNYHGAHQASAGASVTMTGTLGAMVFWLTGGVDVIAFSGGGGATCHGKMGLLGTGC